MRLKEEECNVASQPASAAAGQGSVGVVLRSAVRPGGRGTCVDTHRGFPAD